MSLTDRKDYTHNDYAVGWLCALPKEQTAATAMLDSRHEKLRKPPNDNNTYTLGSMGRHNIVITCLPMGKIGTNQAAAAVTNMVSTFPSIKFVLMVGIGGGIPSNNIRLGDVVVSSPTGRYPGVVQWDMGKATEGGRFERTGALDNPSKLLLTALPEMETHHYLNGPQIPHHLDDMVGQYPRLAAKYLRSDSLQDVLFKANCAHAGKDALNNHGTEGINNGDDDDDDDDDNEDCRFCDRTQIVKRKPRDMQIHYGLIASGNQVIKDAEFRDRLNKELDGKVLCVEMEAAGLMDNFRCLVIRGICDYADSHKNMAWQEHAAAVAAAYAKELLQHVQPNDVDGEHPTKDLVEQVLNTTSTTAANVVQIKARIDSGEDRKILEWLAPMDYGLQQSDYLKRRQKGTGQWLLDSNEFQDWLSTSGQTLFCPGIPGAGKTILTSMVIDHLFTRFYSNLDIGIAYIYCNYQRQNEQNIGNLLASILKQLAESQPSLQDPVRDLYDRHEKRKTRPSYDEISRVLQSVVDSYSRIFIIVDALDECQAADGCRTRFLSELFHLRENGLVSILVTSRDLPEISSHFEEKCTRREIRATTDDITRYLEGSMEPLPSVVQENKGLQREIVIGIAESVDGMFLLAQIYIKLLEDKLTVNAVRSALTVFSKQQSSSRGYERTKILEFAYGQALERINNQMEGQKDLALNVLSWITCAKRPLTLSELQHALATKPGKDSLDEGDLPHIKDLVSFCAGLVTVDKESKIIRLVHYTTQEYLLQTQGRWFPEAGVAIGMACVAYLSFRVFETGSCDTDQEFEQRLLAYPLYDYAASYWGLHIPYETGSDQTVINFLQNQKKIDASVQALMTRMRYVPYLDRGKGPRRMIGLHLVGYFGLSKAVDILVAAGQRVNAQDFSRRTPLIYAARNGHKTTVERLLAAGADINAVDKDGRTVLHEVASFGHLEVIEGLLAAGADINAVNKDDRTVLHKVASFSYLEVIKGLLAAGADINAVDKDDRTVLHEVASFGHLEVIEGLLAAGADINAVDKDGRTVLHEVASFGRLEVIEGLLAAGANVNAADKNNKTALHEAAGEGFHEIVKRLLAAGADVNLVTCIAGLDINARRSFGETALQSSAKGGHHKVTETLLAAGADANAPGSSQGGKTALQLAAERGHYEAVEALLAAGADVHATGSFQARKIALLLAVENGHRKVVEEAAGSEFLDKCVMHSFYPLARYRPFGSSNSVVKR